MRIHELTSLNDGLSTIDLAGSFEAAKSPVKCFKILNVQTPNIFDIGIEKKKVKEKENSYEKKFFQPGSQIYNPKSKKLYQRLNFFSPNKKDVLFFQCEVKLILFSSIFVSIVYSHLVYKEKFSMSNSIGNGGWYFFLLLLLLFFFYFSLPGFCPLKLFRGHVDTLRLGGSIPTD